VVWEEKKQKKILVRKDPKVHDSPSKLKDTASFLKKRFQKKGKMAAYGSRFTSIRELVQIATSASITFLSVSPTKIEGPSSFLNFAI